MSGRGSEGDVSGGVSKGLSSPIWVLAMAMALMEMEMEMEMERKIMGIKEELKTRDGLNRHSSSGSEKHLLVLA